MECCSSLNHHTPFPFHMFSMETTTTGSSRRISFIVYSQNNKKKSSNRRKLLPKNLRYPRRTKLPPRFGVDLFLHKPTHPQLPEPEEATAAAAEEEEAVSNDDDGDEVVWESDELEAISSLFQGRIPQKPQPLNKQRPLPLPLPHKLRPARLPSPKKRINVPPLSTQLSKSPSFLVGLAKHIKSLDPDEDVSLVLNNSAKFLQKGSLSLTIKELGHMGLPQRALQTFCWAQKQPHLFPDDRILASTVEVLARNNDMKLPPNLQNFIGLASRNVIEAMVRGFIRSGRTMFAWNLVMVAKDNNRMLDAGTYAKLILAMGKNPDNYTSVLALLDELAGREDLNLKLPDCTALMKICIRLRRFDVVESLFDWFKQSGNEPSVVLYTTLIHSRSSEERYQDALAVVWEMESSNCLFDLPAYRVVIKLFVALNDLPRAVRYFAKLKEAGFSPTYDIYRDLITVYMVSGRLAKCKELQKEVEMAGLKLDEQLTSMLL